MIRGFKDYLRWVLRWRDRPITAWILASRLFNQGRYREAVQFYLEGLKKSYKHPASKNIRFELAYSFFRIQEVSRAIDQLEKIVAYEPTSKEAVLKIAHLQAWIGRDIEVVSILSKSLRLIQPSREMLSLMALSAMRLKGDSDFVRGILIQAKKPELSSDERGDYLLKIALAKYAFISGDRHIGRKYLLELTNQDNPSPEALVTLSELLLIQGKVVFARQQLRRALSIVPQHPIVLSLLSETYLIEGAGYQPEFALQLALSAVQACCWASPDALYALAKAYLVNEDSDAALMVLEKAHKEIALGINLSRIGESIELLRDQLRDNSA